MDFVMHHTLAKTDFDAVMALGPTVLVADDDPASCRFLCDGLRSLGARSEAVHDGTSALARARQYPFDLLLLDCRMPGSGALQILDALRGSILAQSADSIAIATTAELNRGDREKLLTAGFRDILMKPCELADLQRLLMMVSADLSDQRTLDDQAALTATGDATTMRALRLLLREELLVLTRDLDELSQDATALSDRLHRLRSSCGFCGAAALSQQTVLLQQHLASPATQTFAMTNFRRSLSSTLLALSG
jgi:two-component system OmpR family response regulator